MKGESSWHECARRMAWRDANNTHIIMLLLFKQMNNDSLMNMLDNYYFEYIVLRQ